MPDDKPTEKKYTLSILPSAQKELSRLDDPSYGRVRDAIRELSNTPRPTGCRKLTGRDGWRIRVGDLRVIYEIDDSQKSATVLHIGHRKDVYR